MTASILAIAVLVASPSTFSSFSSFSFEKTGDAGTFVLEVPVEPGTRSVKLRAEDASVFLVVPSEAVLDEDVEEKKSVTFAGRYSGGGAKSFWLEIDEAPPEKIEAAFPESAPADAAVSDRYARALLGEITARIERSGGDAFLASAFEIVRSRHGIAPGEIRRPRSRGTPLPPLALYDVFTGSIALEESLQLEALFSDPLMGLDARERPLVRLSGPKIQSHPFEKMLEGRPSAVERSALAVPEGFLAARFTSLDALARTAEKLEELGSTFLATVTPSGRTPRLRARLEAQLRFKLAPEWRRLLDPHLDSVTVVSSDPFFREGNDVTVLLETKDGPDAAQRMAGLARLALSLAGPVTGLDVATRVVRGAEVKSVTSADRRVSSHVAAAGRYLLVSNSALALDAVLATIGGERPSLGQSAEFRYMRSVLPGADEDAFVYLSDAFVRRVVGPELKIVEARRASCLARRSGVASAALLFRSENGRPPRSIEEMRDLRYLSDGAARCPDGGDLSLDPSGALAACRVHGTGALSAPCLEIECGLVTEREAERYERFVANYNNYWRRYFDPVGLQVRLDDGLAVDTVILPLIDLSLYGDLSRTVGGATAPPLPPARARGEVYRISGRMRPDTLLAMAFFVPGIDLTGVADAAKEALTGAFAVSRFDGEPLIEFQASDYLTSLLQSGAGFDLSLVPVLSAVTGPTAVTAGLKSPESARKFHEAVRAAFAKASRAGSALRALPTVRHYALEREGAAVPVDSVSIEALSFRFRFFFASDERKIVFSNRLDVLDALLESGGGENEAAFEHDLELSIRAREVRRSRPFLELSQAESAREACQENLEGVTSLMDFGRVAPEAIESETLRRFGDAFVCPEGGTYALAGRAAGCSRHGTLASPVQESRPVGAPARLFDALSDVNVRLLFTDDGLRTRVHLK